jgi:hypothetical protein
VRLLLEVCALYYCPASPTSPATSTLPSLPSLPETTNNYLSSRAHFVAVHCLRLIRIDSHRHGHGGSLLETAFNFALLDTAALRGTATLSSSMSSSSSLKQMVRVCAQSIHACNGMAASNAPDKTNSKHWTWHLQSVSQAVRMS